MHRTAKIQKRECQPKSRLSWGMLGHVIAFEHNNVLPQVAEIVLPHSLDVLSDTVFFTFVGEEDTLRL